MLQTVTAADETDSARVLIVDSDQRREFLTRDRLLALGRATVWSAHDRVTAVQAARSQQPEVALIELAFRDCDGPAVALQIAAAARHVEAIFFADPRDEGEIAAARDLGLPRVVLFSELFRSVELLLEPLAEYVRLRRLLEGAERRLRNALAEERGRAGPHRVALPEAERRYRETYVRSLLAETGNRREAARRAGVPYTTFCEIIRKLGIAEMAR